MCVLNVSDYYNITDFDYNDSLSISNNCTNNENKNDINIPTLLLTIQCGLSFLCLMSLMGKILVKPLIRKKMLIIIDGEIFISSTSSQMLSLWSKQFRWKRIFTKFDFKYY